MIRKGPSAVAWSAAAFALLAVGCLLCAKVPNATLPGAWLLALSSPLWGLLALVFGVIGARGDPESGAATHWIGVAACGAGLVVVGFWLVAIAYFLIRLVHYVPQ